MNWFIASRGLASCHLHQWPGQRVMVDSNRFLSLIGLIILHAATTLVKDMTTFITTFEAFSPLLNIANTVFEGLLKLEMYLISVVCVYGIIYIYILLFIFFK